jgi:hypothetical protein
MPFFQILRSQCFANYFIRQQRTKADEKQFAFDTACRGGKRERDQKENCIFTVPRPGLHIKAHQLNSNDMQPKLIQANQLSCTLLLFLFLFASPLNAQPPKPVRSMVFGTMLGEVVNDVCTDAAGNSYYTGMYSATTDFDPGPGVFTLTSSSGLDLFVLKLDAAGNFVWAVSFGSPVSQVAYHVRADNNGHVYVAGWFSDSVDFDPGPGTAMR